MLKHIESAMRHAVMAATAGIGFALMAATCGAATGAGSLDPTFGVGGRKIFNLQPGTDDDIGWGAVQPDGKLVVAGYVPRDAINGSIPVARFLRNGDPDPAFGTGGVTILALDDSAYADSFGTALAPDGRILIAGGAKSNGSFRCVALALRADGTLDPAFANAGVFRYPAVGTSADGCTNLALQPDGKILVLGNRDGYTTNYVLRLLSDGTLDATFGNGGIAALPGSATNFIYGISVGPTGAIYLSGGPGTGAPARIYRLTSSGILDPAFAGGSFHALLQPNSFLHAIKALPDGGAVASGYHAGKHLVVKVDATGAPAAGFGSGGATEFTLGTGYSTVSIDLQGDGKILLGIRESTAGGPFRFAVGRLTANGLFDSTYGDGGISTIDFGTPGEVLYGIAQAPDGKVWAFGRADISATESSIALARFLPDEITTPVVEFFNTPLGHYFITADPNEASAIDAGAAGPGWTRTGQTFKSGGPDKAGRFYGNPDANPATGRRRGPNGHFYSLDPDEIAQVKKDIGWRFESYDFNAWPKTAAACPAGTVAVLRVYNNRFPQNDSNHRYTTVRAIYDQMVAQGWSAEGSVFCAPM